MVLNSKSKFQHALRGVPPMSPAAFFLSPRRAKGEKASELVGR
jgi:hypothetical protein